MTNQTDAVREPSLLDALIPLGFMIIMLTWSIVPFGVDAAAGPLQVALILSAVVALVAHKNGHASILTICQRPTMQTMFCARQG